MNQITEALRDSKRLRLIATALELMQYERTDSAAIPIPGTDPQRYVTIGTAATVAQLLEIAPAAAADVVHLAGQQAKTWKDAPYKLDHVAEAWARGWNDACAELAKPQSDLTTLPCPECAGKCIVDAGEACDECHGQGKIIVSRSDLAPITSTVRASEGDAK